MPPISPCVPQDLPAFEAPANCLNEPGRIIAVALFKISEFDFVSGDWADPTKWAPKITAGDIVIIKPVTGEFPEPSEVTVDGDGLVRTVRTGTDYDVSYSHRGVDDNIDFYSVLNGSNNEYSAGFVFPDFSIYLAADKQNNLIPVTFNARPMAESSLTSQRRFMVNARWSCIDLPRVHKVPRSLFV